MDRGEALVANVHKLLQTQNKVLQQLFSDPNIDTYNLQPQEQQDAERVFREVLPDYPCSLKEFQLRWVEHENEKAAPEMEMTCPKTMYDMGSRRFTRAQVLPMGRRKTRKQAFDLGEFLRTKRAAGDCHTINWESRDAIEDLMDEINENKKQNDARADNVLSRLVQMNVILSASYEYEMLKLHPERRIY